MSRSFDLVDTTIADVADLFRRFHAYESVGKFQAYAFAVIERDAPVAAYVWQPPPPAAARAVCAALPVGVLALSRMVAVPKDERALKHISKPLKYQMRRRIDRSRWPVLITYSDESVGHTGYVYQCSGWTPTVRHRVKTLTVDGKRVSRYSNGGRSDHGGGGRGRRVDSTLGALGDARSGCVVRGRVAPRADRRQGVAQRKSGVSVRANRGGPWLT